jgi:hypothetical protein
MNLAVRIALTLGLPFILVWAFVAELTIGLGRAFLYAWLETKLNLAAYQRLMSESINEDHQ